jgi:hypothetical protein
VEYETDPLQVKQGSRFEEIGQIAAVLVDHSSELPDALTTGCRRFDDAH